MSRSLAPTVAAETPTAVEVERDLVGLPRDALAVRDADDATAADVIGRIETGVISEIPELKDLVANRDPIAAREALAKHGIASGMGGVVGPPVGALAEMWARGEIREAEDVQLPGGGTLKAQEGYSYPEGRARYLRAMTQRIDEMYFELTDPHGRPPKNGALSGPNKMLVMAILSVLTEDAKILCECGKVVVGQGEPQRVARCRCGRVITWSREIEDQT